MANLDLNLFNSHLRLLSKTQEELENIKGDPKKQTTEQGDLYYWYGSIVPHKAEMYRIQNGIVVWTSIDMNIEKVTIKDFMEVLGEPEYSVKRYNSPNDSLQNKVIAWPSKGYALIASGNDQYAQVTRLEFFQPETLEQYLTNWGKDYADKEKVNLIITPTSYPTGVATTIPTNQNTSILTNSQIRNELLLLCLVIVFTVVFCVLIWRRRRVK